MLNFNIIDGVDVHKTYDFEELKKDYLDMNNSVNDIMEKYGFSSGQWVNARKRLEDAGVPLRGTHTKQMRTAKHYIYDRRRNRYKVCRNIGGKHYYFGVYKTEEEAKARVQELRDKGWDGLE